MLSAFWARAALKAAGAHRDQKIYSQLLYDSRPESDLVVYWTGTRQAINTHPLEPKF